MIPLDIETIPQQPEEEAKKLIAETITAPATMKVQDTIDKWHAGEGKYAGVKEREIENQYRRTSFDGAKGEVASISWSVGIDGKIMSMSRASFPDEAQLLGAFALELAKSSASNYFIGHHIRFDLKFLWQRYVINNVNPGVKFPFNGRHGKDFFCTQEEWAGFKQTISQDNLCKALGLPPKPDDIDGSKVWDHYKDGNIVRIEEYNRSDIGSVQDIYKRLTFGG